MATLEKRVPNDTGAGWRTVPKADWQRRHPGAQWRVKIRRKGVPTLTATFERKTDAAAWGAKIETAIKEGRHFGDQEASRHTVSDLVERYVRDVCPQKKDGDKQAGQLQWWKEQLGAYLLKDLTPALVAEARDKLAATPTLHKKRRSGSTVNRYLAALSHACTQASREWGWIEDNPVKRVSRRKEPKGRVRYLDGAERQRLLAACSNSSASYLYPVVVLALSTGMRKGEIFGLKWRDVDLKRGHVTLHDTKNGQRRGVAIVGHAGETLKDWGNFRELASDLVFPRTGSFERRWRAARDSAEIQDLRFHDLRHSAASYLAMGGASPSEIAGVLGHKTLAMVKRYAHLSDEHLRGVVSKMNDGLFTAENQ